MAPENDDRLLSRIFDQLTAIERTLEGMREDVTILKTERKVTETLANDVRALGERVRALELKSSEWGGAGGMVGKGAGWVSSIVSALIVAAVVGAITLLRK